MTFKYLPVVLSLFVASPLQAGILYRIEPSFTQVTFNVDNMGGLFSTHGHFDHFSGTLELDLSQPQNSQVDVSLDSQSVSTGWEMADDMLKSSDYLDPSKFAHLHFVSQSIEVITPDHVHVHGLLTLRDKTLPMILDAHLQGKHEEPGLGPIADFNLKGSINRDDYGMVQDHPLIASVIEVTINAHIRLDPVTAAP